MGTGGSGLGSLFWLLLSSWLFDCKPEEKEVFTGITEVVGADVDVTVDVLVVRVVHFLNGEFCPFSSGRKKHLVVAVVVSLWLLNACFKDFASVLLNGLSRAGEELQYWDENTSEKTYTDVYEQ